MIIVVVVVGGGGGATAAAAAVFITAAVDEIAGNSVNLTWGAEGAAPSSDNHSKLSARIVGCGFQIRVDCEVELLESLFETRGSSRDF